MSKYCLDTNIILLISWEYKEWSNNFFKKQNLEKHLLKANINDLCICEIIKFEVQHAQYKYENKNWKNIPYEELNDYQRIMLNTFKKRNKIIAKLQIYYLDSKSITIYKDTDFQNKSWQKDHCDFFIASICITNGLTLITDDKDFNKIDWLEIANWTK